MYFCKCNAALNALKESIGTESYVYEKGKTFSLTFSTCASPHILKTLNTEAIQSILYYVIRSLRREISYLDLEKFSEDKGITYYNFHKNIL